MQPMSADQPRKFFPVGLDLSGRRCLVVGAGAVGARKARTLAEAGAQVTVIAPEGPSEADGLAGVRRRAQAYRPEHLEGFFLVVAATDDRKLNRAVCRDAEARGLLACDASSAARTRLAFGAAHYAEGLTIAVFTDGRDPERARRVRDQIARMLDER